MLLQQQQFQEAMRIQMAMKHMPIESGEIPIGATMGLRVKKNGIPEPAMTHEIEDPPFEEQLT